MGLLDQLNEVLVQQPRKYWGDKATSLGSLLSDSAATGAQAYGSANSPMAPEHANTLAGLLADFTPGLGDVKSAYDGMNAAREGDYLGAALGGLGALPLVPNITKNVGDWLHGSSAIFDEFKLQPKRNPAIFLSPVRSPNMVTQAEHISQGPFGGQLYRAAIDGGKKFDPLNDPAAAEIYKKLFPDRPLRQWVEYPDIHIDSPIIKAMQENGYNRVRVDELGGRGFSEAVTDPSLLRILERESVR